MAKSSRGVLDSLLNGTGNSAGNLGIVILTLAAAAAVTIHFRFHGLYLGTFAVMISWYVLAARSLARESPSAPDSLVIAEQIVTFGVVSLIVHVVVAGFELKYSWQSANEISLDMMWTSAQSLGEGLMCAALAPLLAMVARTWGFANDLKSEEIEVAITANQGSSRQSERSADYESRTLEAANHFSQEMLKHQEAIRFFTDSIRNYAESTPDTIARMLGAIDGISTSLAEQETRLTAELVRRSGEWEARASQLDKIWLSLGDNLRIASEKMIRSFESASDDINSGSKSVAGGLESAGNDVRNSSKALRDDFLLLAVKLNEHGRLLSTSLEGIASDVTNRTKPIGDAAGDLEERMKLLSAGFARFEERLDRFGAELPVTLGSVSAGFDALNRGSADLTTQLREGGALVQGLQSLILSVRRFIPADENPTVDEQEKVT